MKPDSREFERFTTIWQRAATIYGQEISPEQIQAYARVLADVPLGMLEKALFAHMRDPERGRFMPRPADVLAQVNGVTMGHPGPEEAWAIAQQAADEADTVVWTDEIAAAWSVAEPTVQAGDMIGGRMAFIEKYRQIMRETRSEPVWRVSLGHDTSLRYSRLLSAIEAGRLPRQQAERLMLESNAASAAPALPEPDSTAPTEQQEAIAKLRALLNRLDAQGSEAETQRQQDEQQRREREEQRRQQLQEQAAALEAAISFAHGR